MCVYISANSGSLPICMNGKHIPITNPERFDILFFYVSWILAVVEQEAVGVNHHLV